MEYVMSFSLGCPCFTKSDSHLQFSLKPMRMVSIFDRWLMLALTPPLAPLQTITYFQRVLHVKGPYLQCKIDFKVDISRLADGL
jgi:hypothetical protein